MRDFPLVSSFFRTSGYHGHSPGRACLSRRYSAFDKAMGQSGKWWSRNVGRSPLSPRSPLRPTSTRRRCRKALPMHAPCFFINHVACDLLLHKPRSHLAHTHTRARALTSALIHTPTLPLTLHSAQGHGQFAVTFALALAFSLCMQIAQARIWHLEIPVRCLGWQNRP